MTISAIPSSLGALSLSLSQLQDTASVIAAASQPASAVSSQANLSAAQSPAVISAALPSYGAGASYSSGVVVGNSVDISA